jgi:BON domain
MYGATGSGAANRGGTGYNSSQSGRGQQSSQFGGQGLGRQGGQSRRGTGQSGQQGQYGQGGAAAGKQQVWFEPRIEVGFTVSAPQASVIQADVARPLHVPALSSRFGTVQVSVMGDTVILRGTVTSENDRLLAAQMAMLEPAVSSVRNELTVAPAATPPGR